jgi:plastocyanin
MKKLLIRVAMALPLLLLAGMPAAADTSVASATVVMTDTGFEPAAVTIVPGGAVTFINKGSNVHNATSIGGAPLPFNTGGLGPGQSTSMSFGVPGKYYYTSATDCLTGGYSPQFPCSISFLVNVTSAEVVATSAAATAAVVPTYTPSPTPVPANLPQPTATVYITDTGITPETVYIALNGSVTFINQGSTVHTATSPGTSTWQGFDSGGLAPGGIYNLGFATAGTYTFSSAPDCLNGNNNPQFKCSTTYSVVVGSVPVPQPTTVPTAGPTAVPPLAQPNPNTKITIGDSGGFQPSTLTVKAGQVVTWTNTGANTHTATSNQGYLPAFDSGGLSLNQSFSWTFATPGTFGYHSQTDVTYSNNTDCNCVIPIYSFNGTIIVTP